jgi:transposase
LGTKLHAIVDALGLPVRFALGPGQQNDMAPACELVRDLPAAQLIADRAYDADSLHDLILDQGGDRCSCWCSPSAAQAHT